MGRLLAAGLKGMDKNQLFLSSKPWVTHSLTSCCLSSFVLCSNVPGTSRATHRNLQVSLWEKCRQIRTDKTSWEEQSQPADGELGSWGAGRSDDAGPGLAQKPLCTPGSAQIRPCQERRLKQGPLPF